MMDPHQFGTSVLSGISHAEVWAVIILGLFSFIAIKACRVKFPDPGTVQSYATVSNTKGGIILILLGLWFFTLALIVAFSVWILIRGGDPENAVVVQLLGVLTGTAFGTVNGALFKTMTGEDPKPPVTSVVRNESTVSETPPVPNP